MRTSRAVALGTAGLVGAAALVLVTRAQPLRVVEAGWSTAGRATGVPPGAVAVGSEVGRVTETAALRVRGDGDVLRLALVRDRSIYPEDARLRVCPAARGGWTAAEPGPPVEAASAGCRPVVLRGDVAVLDLTGWADRSAGLVLLPDLSGDTSPRTFRLALDPTATA